MIKKLVKSIKKRLLGVTSKELLDDLKLGGAVIGNGTYVFDTKNVFIDTTRPWLLNICSYVKITRGVCILTHDYSLSVLRRKYGEWIGEGAETVIGDNCFIGMNSIILMGARLGNNCVVGAGTILTGEYPSNVVIAGNPGRVIHSLDEYYNSRTAKSDKEAVRCAQLYYERVGKVPEPRDLSGFKFLFTPRKKDFIDRYGLSFECSGDDKNEVEQSFYNTQPKWKSFEEFIKFSIPEIEDVKIL